MPKQVHAKPKPTIAKANQKYAKPSPTREPREEAQQKVESQKKHQSQKNSPNRNPGHGLKASKPKPIIAQEQSILIHDQRGAESPQAPQTQDVSAMPT